MGGESRATHHKLYVNVMELLVAEEVDRHLASLPERVSRYIKRTEVETFALNRLPALYASSEKGLQHQYEKAIGEYKSQIHSAVRQAFAAVQVDPIRLSQPLQLNNEEEAVLEALRELLSSPDLTWKSALHEIHKLQQRRSLSKTIPPALPLNPAIKAPPPPRPTFREREIPDQAHDSDSHDHSTAWRPGTYGSRISWKPHRSHSTPDSGFTDNAL